MSGLAEALARSGQDQGAAEGRLSGVKVGVVTDVRDPQSIGRVKVRLEGMQPSDDADWAVPAWPGSIEGVPRVGDTVVLLFHDGDPHRAFWLAAPKSSTGNRPTEAMVLGTIFMRLHNDLVAKFNALQGHYQAFYAFAQGHVHASFGTVSASLVEGLIGPTSHNTGANAGLAKASDGSVPGALASDQVVLSGEAKVR